MHTHTDTACMSCYRQSKGVQCHRRYPTQYCGPCRGIRRRILRDCTNKSCTVCASRERDHRRFQDVTERSIMDGLHSRRLYRNRHAHDQLAFTSDCDYYASKRVAQTFFHRMPVPPAATYGHTRHRRRNQRRRVRFGRMTNAIANTT